MLFTQRNDLDFIFSSVMQIYNYCHVFVLKEVNITSLIGLCK